jgi:uncharacterized membrane protein YhaH (DUF805 family)
MTEEWHVSIDGNQQGPLSPAAVSALARHGRLKPTDHVWKVGMKEWVAANTVKGLFPQGTAVSPQPPAPPPLDPNPAIIGTTGRSETARRTGPVSFGVAISTGVSKLFDFTGRASRSEFWWFYLFLLLIWLPIVFVALSAGVSREVMQVAGYLFFGVALSGVGARRLHDTNRSGWWQLLMLTGIGGIALVIWWGRKGTPGSNRFGEPVG